LRPALIDAALAIVERKGAQALSLRGAARRARVSAAAPYRHFRDKEALLAAVAEEGFRALAASMARAADRHRDVARRFESIGVSYIHFANQHPGHFRVMFGLESAERSAYPGLQQAGAEAFSQLMAAIRECQRQGVIRAGDARPLSLAAWSLVHGFSALLIDGQLLSAAERSSRSRVDRIAREVARTFLRGAAGPTHSR
jgi:AcrR family transcriptional regulator